MIGLDEVKSGVGIDIAKNHTGIAVWDGIEFKCTGFKLSDWGGVHAEYELRKEFKGLLREVLAGGTYELVVVEGVYGGQNFETVRKLLALNTVVDELLDEGVYACERFMRLSKSQWASGCGNIYRSGKKLKSKLETQEFLGYIGCEWYELHKGYPDTKRESALTGLPTKKELFFEDVCDAMAMLIGGANLFGDVSSGGKIRKLKPVYLYLSDPGMRFFAADETFRTKDVVEVELKGPEFEDEIKEMLEPGVICKAYLPPSRLGRFGIRHGFTFFEEDDGWLFFYGR